MTMSGQEKNTVRTTPTRTRRKLTSANRTVDHATHSHPTHRLASGIAATGVAKAHRAAAVAAAVATAVADAAVLVKDQRHHVVAEETENGECPLHRCPLAGQGHPLVITVMGE